MMAEVGKPRSYTRREWAILAGVVAAGGAASIALRQNADLGVDLGAHSIVQRILDDPIAPQITPAGSDISLAVFSDYRCPICRRSDDALMAVTARDRSVRVIFKEWPIFGGPSKAAAITALAAERQGAYVPVRSMLLNAPQIDAPTLERIVLEAGAEWPPIRAEIDTPDRTTIAQLQAAQNDALALGLRGTPAYLIGSILVEGALSEDELERVLSQARQV